MRPTQMFKILTTCGLLAACSQQPEAAPPPQEVRVSKVTSTPVQAVAEITGEVRARTQTDLSFRVGGRVVERLVDVGSHVHAGDVLARLSDTEQRTDLKAAMASLDAAKALAKQRALTLDRTRNLLKSQVIANQVFEGAQKDWLSAQAGVEAAEAVVATARDALSFTELRAVADGIITSRGIEIGEVVSPAQLAFKLAHDGPRDVVFSVFEAFFLDGPPLPDIRVALLSNRQQGFPAAIREISPVVDAKTGAVRVKATLPEEAGWPLGTTAVVRLLSAPHKRVVLPYTAIASDEGATAVWTVDTKRCVALRRVAVESYRRNDFILKGGVDVGDVVVVEGGKFLRGGQVVRWEAM